MAHIEDFRARRHPRTNCVMTVQADTPQGSARAVCRNVSRGGAFITGVLRPPGERIALLLEVPGLGQIHAEAQIAYHHAHPDGTGMGVVFTKISDDDQGVLDRFIDLFARPR